jgi:cytochrome c oxidase subunit 1
MHLATPEGLLQPDIYNRMFTMHGIVMVWFFLIPSIDHARQFHCAVGDWRP